MSQSTDRTESALDLDRTGPVLVRPADERAALAGRADRWTALLNPTNSYQAWIVGQVVLASARLDRCALIESARRVRQAHRAATRWDEDRRLEVEELAERLSSKPALVARRLRQTSQGCDWLIARWDGLIAALATSGELDARQRARAFDLLGVPPEERADDPRLPEGDADALATLAREQVEDLESEKADSLDELDAEERADAENGLAFDASPEARLLMRHEAACNRLLHWGLAQLGASRRLPSVKPLPAPAHRPHPVPNRPRLPVVEPTSTIAPSAISPTRVSPQAFAPAIAPPPTPPRNRRARRALAKLGRSA